MNLHPHLCPLPPFRPRAANRGIGGLLFIDGKTVESHIASILTKLDLPPASDDHRRVLAVLTWLRGGGRD